MAVWVGKISMVIFSPLIFFFLQIKGKALLYSTEPWTTDTRWLNPQFFAAQIQIPIPNKYLRFGYKGLVFYSNNGWLMENMDKGLTLPKWVLINRLKIPQNFPKIYLPKLSAQAQKFGISTKKGFIGRP